MLVPGVIVPVEGLMINPAGAALNVPPPVPVIVAGMLDVD